MTQTQYREKAISKALENGYASPVSGNQQRRLGALAALINGIVGSKRCQLSLCASSCGGEAKTPSRTRFLERFVANKWVDIAMYYLPHLRQLIIQHLACGKDSVKELHLILDSSSSGSCTTWMVSLACKRRSIPIYWQTLKQKKGHAPQELPCELLDVVYSVLADILPSDVRVIVLGDGEFDTCAFQAAISAKVWFYVLRTAKNLTLEHQGETFGFDSVSAAPGESTFWLENVAITRRRFTNGGNALFWHEPKFKEPLYLLTNLDNAPDACSAYGKRFLIETLFSDIKSRGFHFHKTRLKDPLKIQRLLIAVALAYIWLLWLGTLAQQNPYYRERLHRKDRSDWSCFRFGLELLNELLRTDDTRFWVSFILDS